MLTDDCDAFRLTVKTSSQIIGSPVLSLVFVEVMP